MSTQSTHLMGIVDGMLTQDMLSTTESAYLKSLIASPEGDVPTEAAFYAYLRTNDLEALQDTLMRVGGRWRRETPHQELLDLLLQLFETVR